MFSALFATGSASASPSRRYGATGAARAVAATVVKSATAGIMAVGNGLERAFAAHERWRQRQALLALDDFMLSDIGITRADVEREVSKSLWRD